MRAAKAVRCTWRKRKGAPHTYDCPDCGCWTSNLPAYRYVVCDAKDRRKGMPERRGRA